MFSQILFDKITVLCPQHHRYIDVPIQYIKKGDELYLCDAKGCDDGFDNSPKCQDCLRQCIVTFREGFAK